MKTLDILRGILGIGSRRIRDALGLGDRRQASADRRRSQEQVRQAAWAELDRLAWIKFKGPRPDRDDPGVLEDWGGHA